MSLTKHTINAFIIVFSGILLVLATTTIFFPRMIDNIITGFASMGSFQVALSLIAGAEFDINNSVQLDPAIVNGTNITILTPVIYHGNAIINLSAPIPSGFECGFDWYVNESGAIKGITDNGTALYWEADETVTPTALYFEVPPPSIISEVVYSSDSYYEKTLVISSCCLLNNVIANVSVSSNYTAYVLYLIENSSLIDKTVEYHLQVSNGMASFYGFNLSNKTFRIQTAQQGITVNQTSVSYVNRIGPGLTFFRLNQTLNKKFIVEPDSINIYTTALRIFNEQITIYNLLKEQKEFTIDYTEGFILLKETRFTIPANSSKTVLIDIDASAALPGTNTGFIYVRSEGVEERVIINLDVTLEKRAEEKLPKKEQPKPIIQIQKEQPTELLIVLAILFGLITLFGIVLFINLRRAFNKRKNS